LRLLRTTGLTSGMIVLHFGRPGSWEEAMNKEHVKLPLRVVERPALGPSVTAPPVLNASSNTVDFTCGSCGTLLLHAEEGQIYGVVIECAECGACNATGV
jgi:hypothetical protein